jgi:SAM-dependent methyltransferase
MGLWNTGICEGSNSTQPIYPIIPIVGGANEVHVSLKGLSRKGPFILTHYNNKAYWKDLHARWPSKLSTVGHPYLSEALNRLKYQSEAKTFLGSLQEVDKEFKETGRRSLSVLDIGAGSGYWTELIWRALLQEGHQVRLAALDISMDALSAIRQKCPSVETIQGDVTAIDPYRFQHAFDLVISCYCLHHLVHVEGFLNALRFACKSVNSGGFLIIIDPVLTLPFSRFDVLDFASFRGNGIPRHLYFLEDILQKEGLGRLRIDPAVSFLLNGNIEGKNKMTYEVANMIWRILCKFIYKSQDSVQLISGLLVVLDEALKKLNLAYSSKVCVYRKSPRGGMGG